MPKRTPLYEIIINGFPKKAKYCKICEKLLPLDNYHTYNSRGYTYHLHYCIECGKKKSKVYYKNNKQKAIESAKANYERNKERMIQYKKKWYQQNRESQIRRAVRIKQIKKALHSLRKENP